MTYIFINSLIGLIICLPILWVAKLKTDLNITNRKLAWWRNRAIKLNKEIKSGKIS